LAIIRVNYDGRIPLGEKRKRMWKTIQAAREKQRQKTPAFEKNEYP
jgi:hypothetical protein